MIMVFAVWLGWLPPSGARDWPSLIMPSVALGLLSMATFARVARTAVLDELEKDYVRTAHAKGVPTTRIVIRHLLRNASIPVVTVAALEIANLLAGAVIVETVFAWPGLGQLTVQAIAARDFMLVQGLFCSARSPQLHSISSPTCSIVLSTHAFAWEVIHDVPHFIDQHIHQMVEETAIIGFTFSGDIDPPDPDSDFCAILRTDGPQQAEPACAPQSAGL